MTGWVDSTNWLRTLRETFPDWAFLYDPWHNTWSALRGKDDRVTATTAIELNALLREKRSRATSSRAAEAAARLRAGQLA